MYTDLNDILTNRISEQTLIQLTDDEGLGVVNETKVAGAINDATDIIHGFCRGVYPLPLAPVPDVIRTIARDLATYSLYGLRPECIMPDTVSDRQKTALRLLQRVQDGKMALYDEDIPADTPATGGVAVVAAVPTFTKTSLENF